jgi:hypothetical protein
VNKSLRVLIRSTRWLGGFSAVEASGRLLEALPAPAEHEALSTWDPEACASVTHVYRRWTVSTTLKQAKHTHRLLDHFLR